MTLLAIDPGRSFKGEASIGVSIWWDGTWQETIRRSLTFEELVSNLEFRDEGAYATTPWLEFDGYQIHEVVIEDFVNNAQSKGGQRNGTSECIGAVEFACIKAEVPLIRQEPAALGPAKLHAPAGSWKPLKHLRHEDSAYLHGYEYLVRKGVLQPARLAETMTTDHEFGSTT